MTNTGHAHPRVVAAVAAQAAKLLHGQQNIVYHEPGLRLHERLQHVLPGSGWGAFLSNSGAEAVEAAVKLARVATGRPAIIAFRGGFHGRTAQAMALTVREVRLPRRLRAAPRLRLPRGLPLLLPGARRPTTPRACTCDWEAELDLLFHSSSTRTHVAAIIVEPVLGEGGYVVPPAWFLPRLREITRQHGILLIADEVQTGFGRTGRFSRSSTGTSSPDILIMAKGIASGLPLSGSSRSARCSPLGAGCPRRHVRRQRGRVRRGPRDARRDRGRGAGRECRGPRCAAARRAAGARGRPPGVGDVRGLGCMVALEFVEPASGDGRAPDPAMAKRVIAEALARHLSCSPPGRGARSCASSRRS